MKRNVSICILIIMMISSVAQAQEKILTQFDKAGIWKIDRSNHRCLIDLGVWDRLPMVQKEQTLQLIYVEEKTWWKIYDRMSGKLLGEVSSWGWKIYP